VKKKSPLEKQIERELGWVAVCLVGPGRRVPRDFGDNYGAHPIRVVVCADPADATDRYNPGSPTHEYRVLTWAYVEHDAYAARVRAHIEASLRSEAERLLHGWFDLDIDEASLLLVSAAEAVPCDLFDEESRRRIVEAVIAQRHGRVRRAG
jgi:hypothetical protein